MDQMPHLGQYRSSQRHTFTRTGQQKLLVSDLRAYICFVGEFRKIPKYVVVAGAAPGNHFETLIQMLPRDTEWNFYDPENFCPSIGQL